MLKTRLPRPGLGLQAAIVLLLFLSESTRWASAVSVSTVVGGINSTPTHPSPASTFWNPALLGFCPGNQIETNLSLVGGWMSYSQTSSGQSASTSAFAPNPYLAISSPFGTDKFRFGYSTYFPGGVMASFDPNGPQKYDLIRGLILPWHHQLTVAYRPIPELAIGVSGIFSLAFFQTDLDVDLSGFSRNTIDPQNPSDIPQQHPAMASPVSIPLSMTEGYGYALGIVYWPTYQWSFGVSFFSPIHYSFDTQLNFNKANAVNVLGSGLGALGFEDQTSSSVVVEDSLPAFVQVGVRFQPYGYWTGEYFGRYSFYSWDRSLSLRVTNSPIAVARSYHRDGVQLNDTYLIGTVQSLTLWQKWNLGINTTYSTNSVRGDTLSPAHVDFDSFLVGLFSGYEWNRRWTIGAEYAHIFYLDRSGHSAASASNAIFQPQTTSGEYRASSDRLGIGVKYAF